MRVFVSGCHVHSLDARTFLKESKGQYIASLPPILTGLLFLTRGIPFIDLMNKHSTMKRCKTPIKVKRLKYDQRMLQ